MNVILSDYMHKKIQDEVNNLGKDLEIKIN